MNYLLRPKINKKFLLPFIDKSFSFLPKKPFQILAERRVSRREASSFHLRNPELRCLLDKVRNYFEQNPND
ncbi:MAG: hypothetical protein A2562_04665 [Candidatus Nealsonbacteria bacterium RIFOXYD1_FULL_39_11]|nr:MAG: hypothetical protein A2562_04665 [Candidatus Nealsonbacteria bacterium RIFOXYD1_FULL_39_11]